MKYLLYNPLLLLLPVRPLLYCVLRLWILLLVCLLLVIILYRQLVKLRASTASTGQ